MENTKTVVEQPLNVSRSSGSLSRGLKRWLVSLGPGIITAAVVFGPSKITITSKMGAAYGYQLLWVVPVAIFFLIVFTSMSERIARSINQSLLTTIREKWGRPVALFIGLGIFLVTASFQAGNSIGVGISVAEWNHSSPVPWVAVFTLAGISLLFFRTFYKVLEKVMIFLVVLMLFSFVSTLFLAKPPAAEVASGFVPTVPDGSLGLLIAFMASAFSIVAAFYQCYLVQERKRVNNETQVNASSSVIGILILGFMSAAVLICAAAVLKAKGINVNSATDIAKALEPVYGRYATSLFLVGLFGASFSSLIGNAAIGGTLLGDALGYGSQLNAKPVRLLIALVMVIGATVAIVFGKLPLQLIVLAQSVTIFVVPFIGIAMYAIANDQRIMGKRRNSVSTRIAGAAGLLVIIALAIMNIKTLFFNT
ncbi:MAG TPA: Nramp family divalent metal transporter [Flavisolibacter sp.]|jgi:Mn2+/Fe2+ NRAMP family transporter|nr:Nramp family divalent metal transporter [Flavisolibacter sp.]